MPYLRDTRRTGTEAVAPAGEGSVDRRRARPLERHGELNGWLRLATDPRYRVVGLAAAVVEEEDFVLSSLRVIENDCS